MRAPKARKPYHILFASDGSEHASAAACLIHDLFLPPGSSVTILGVLTPRDASSYALLEAGLQHSQDILQDKDVTLKTELVTGYPAEKIIEWASDLKPHLIVMGAKGLRHTLGILLGGVAQQVVEYARSSVLVVRAPYAGLSRILLLSDGSIFSKRILDFLGGRAGRPPFPLPAGAAIRVATVAPPPATYRLYLQSLHLGPEVVAPIEELAARQEDEERLGCEILAGAIQTLQDRGIQADSVLLSGDAATEIIEYVKANQIDLILAGSRGLGPVKGWLLGSVSRKLVHYAGCSVLIVK